MTSFEWLLGFILAGVCLWLPICLIRWLANALGPTNVNGETIDDYILRGGKRDDSN